jgi:Plasmid pRiA4b ORF-3-like protein
MIVYRFKVIFEEVDEVERMIDIRANQTFRDFYRAIIESIKFDANVEASFFISGDNWRKGKEITSSDKEGVLQMADCKLNRFVNDPHQKIMLSTHDQMEWALRIQLFKIHQADNALAYPLCIKSIGVAPKQNKVVTIGLATNEFEELVDEIISEEEQPDISEMGFDDGEGDGGADESSSGEERGMDQDAED